MADLVETTAAQVESHLKGFGAAISKVGPGTYFAKKGSTLVGIRVLPWKEDDTVVYVSANVVEGADLTAPELLVQLLEHNDQACYGAFGVSPDGMITLHHALLGSTLKKDELVAVVLEIARVADDWDDRIVQEVGGKTAVARLQEHIRDKKASGTGE
jgi:hypothetical protein